ncbi:MAG: mechanosensitive ion channel [Methanosarcinaceae archaeon]|nr:mechanosensitive ion channel [Methanosarcinaceae archaeon]
MKSRNPYFAAHIKYYASILIWTVAIILGIKQAGISTDILILLIGLVGVGFIVSASYVLQNFVSRTFLNMQMQYKTGDIISIKEFSGKIIEITDLNTVLLDNEGNLVAVPNVLFLKEIWIKHKLSGYEMTLPIIIKKEIDAVSFEKELLDSIKSMKKYFKKEPGVVTTKMGDKITELTLTLNLKDPEKKSIVTVEANEILGRLITQFTENTEKEKSETQIKELKDISQ